MPNTQYELKQVQVRLKLAEVEPLYSETPITDSDKAVEVMAKVLAEMDREYFCVINLDTRRRAINCHTVAVGNTDAVEVPVQNIFKAGLLSNAKSILCMHCHPSGSLEPSQPDLNITKRIVEAGNIIGIPVTDHIIVAGGTGSYTSLRSTNPELFRPIAAEHQRVSVKEKISEKGAILLKNREVKTKKLQRDKAYARLEK